MVFLVFILAWNSAARIVGTALNQNEIYTLIMGLTWDGKKMAFQLKEN